MRVLAGLLFTVACLSAAAPARAADRVVVRFSSSADASDRAAARDKVDAVAPRPVPGLTGVQVIDVPEGDAAAAARALDRTDGVIWAQPAQRAHATRALPTGAGSDSELQWGLLNSGQAIDGQTGVDGVDGDFTPAWDVTTGAGQTIAVVDTGVDFRIGDLAVNRAAGGYDFVGGDSDPSPASGDWRTSHGTHVAGIAAAALGVQQSSGDITGGAPGAHILAVRALDQTGSGWDTDIASAFDYAADHGARVVNASLGVPAVSHPIDQAIATHPNTLFVVAAGNSGYDEDAHSDYPCKDPAVNVICVAAVDNAGKLASFSNYGATSVDVAAPGVAISSYTVGGPVQAWDGTSMATPFVSAAAALAFAANPKATPSQVRATVIASARRLASLSGRTVSGGMIDAAALVRQISALPAAAPAPAPKATPVAPRPVATPTPTPVRKPVATPAPALSPRLSLHKLRRRGRTVAVSGSVARSFHGTVTVKACAGRRCRTVRVHAREGAFAAKVRPPKHGRVVVTVSVPAGGGFTAASAHRAIRV